MYLTQNDIIENIRWDLYRDIDLAMLKDEEDPTDKSTYEFIEQHCYLNLLNRDEGEDDPAEDYKQPYIVTIHKKSREVLRIVARFTLDDVMYNSKNKIKRINPQHFFSDYHFIPSPKGRFMSLGFGTLLLDMNLMANSLLNQIINCGTLSMTQGGFYSKEANIRPDDFIVEPGEWIPADSPMGGGKLADHFMPFSYQPPSPVLFSLLEVLLNAGKELTSTTEALTGMQDATNASPNTVLALIQQGLKVFTAIQRRIFRGFKKELQKLVRLNAQYLTYEEYLSIIDINPAEVPELFDASGNFIEYQMQNIDIVPVADLTVSTEAEHIQRANIGLQTAMQAAQIMPGTLDNSVILKDFYKALDYPNVDLLIKPPQPPQPDPKTVDIQSQIDERGKRLELDQQDLQLRAQEVQAKIEHLHAQSVKAMADAKVQDKQAGIQAYSHILNSQTKQEELELRKEELKLKDKELDIKDKVASKPAPKTSK
jgi:hypothetical protein